MSYIDGSLWKLIRYNTTLFLDVISCHIRNTSLFITAVSLTSTSSTWNNTMDAPSRTSLRQGTGKRKSTLREGDHEWYDDTVKVKRTEVPTGNYKIDNYNI